VTCLAPLLTQGRQFFAGESDCSAAAAPL